MSSGRRPPGGGRRLARRPALAATGALRAALLAALALGRGAAAPDRPPGLHDLRRGFLAGASDEVQRAGLRAASRGLSRALAGADRVLAMAAADAAPSAEDAIWLLVPLAR